MAEPLASYLTRTRLPWWTWPKLLGPAAVIAALPSRNPLLIACAAHILCDFTLLTPGLCRARARGSRPALSLHALVAGGIPGFIAGGLPGLALCAVLHFLVDRTNKFGCGSDDALGIAADQLCHLAALVALGTIKSITTV